MLGDITQKVRIDSIAEICHEVNRVWCQQNGDNSQRSWENAEEWQRESALRGVLFAISQPDAPDSAQHDAWVADKLLHGWTYGEVKDAEAKTHPCLVPFEDLPEFQKVKDRLFQAIVKAMS